MVAFPRIQLAGPVFHATRTRRKRSGFAVRALLFAPLLFGLASWQSTEELTPEQKAEAVAAGQEQVQRFQIPEGFAAKLWATEPLLANPVAIDVDHRGRVFVAETYRQETEGVPDNRAHRYWIDDDLRLNTVEERGAMYLKHHPEYAESWTKHTDRITRVVDTDGDGVGDASTVFADGFDDLLDGTGAGVLVRGSEAWYTCIPKVWKLTDADDDGVSDSREALHHGYGVRVALRGHDLHGLVMGPDGRMYFSIGDRGYNIETADGRILKDPGAGAVFRCELDGSNLEVFATGLRNPQELAFDDRGNLFTGDNNCDAGDGARLVYVMEGGDCGWSMNFQYLPDRGPWMSESWWKPSQEGQPAFLNTPLANLAAGPSGLAYYPGVGLPEALQGSFFLVDFRGGAGYSGVHRFTVKPDGGGFALDHAEQFWWGVLATDVTFGPDGKLYLADWVETWTGTGKGRVYTLEHEEAGQGELVKETQAILNVGMGERGKTELLALLGHPDYRVRLEAQLALTQLGQEAQPDLTKVALGEGTEDARVHAIWALARLQDADSLSLLLADKNDEIRAQAARGLGQCKGWSPDKLFPLLSADSKRVQYHAAQSLGALGDPRSMAALMTLIERNQGKDRFVRHAASFALSKVVDAETLVSLGMNGSQELALCVVLALRHQNAPELAEFVSYSSRFVGTEATIAIYDRNVDLALPALADELARHPVGLPAPMARRCLHAANRLGRLEPIVSFAAARENSEVLRKEAADLIGTWHAPKEFDAMRNESRTFEARTGQADLVEIYESTGIAGAPELRLGLVALALQQDGEDTDMFLARLMTEERLSDAVRIACLRGLEKRTAPNLGIALEWAHESRSQAVIDVATEIQGGWPEVTSPIEVGRMLKFASTVEQRKQLAAWGTSQDGETEEYLVYCVNSLIAGRVKPDVQVELAEAVDRRKETSPALNERWAVWKKQAEEANSLGTWISSLHGGDIDQGRKVFHENPAAQCTKCHALQGQDVMPAEAGPALDSVGLLHDREYLLHSILEPSRDIAAGFELYNNQGKLQPTSAMLPIYKVMLKPREVRDLVAYLASLKKPKHLAVYVHSAGYEHEVAKREGEGPSQVEREWKSWADNDERFSVEWIRDPAWFEGPGLNKADAVFFYTTGTLPLSENGRTALREYVKQGGGFVGAHCASDTYFDWPWYGEMIGGYFAGHPWGANDTVTIRMEDHEHRACDHLPESWELTEEIYQFKEPYSRKKQHVLMSLDPTKTDMTKKDMLHPVGDYAIAWTRKQGKGKVFYTSLGHRPDVWTNPLYKEHLVEGLLWAAR